MNNNNIYKLKEINLYNSYINTATEILIKLNLNPEDNLVLNYLLNFQSKDAVKTFTANEYFENPINVRENVFYNVEKKIDCSKYKLPPKIYLNDNLNLRKSYRNFENAVCSDELITLLVSVISFKNNGKKNYPSGGALYPIKIMLYVEGVDGLADGIYFYDDINNELILCSINPSTLDIEYILKGQSISFHKSKILLFYIYDLLGNYIKYFDLSLSLAFIEVGAIMELFHVLSPSLKIGICDIGGFPKNKIEKWLDLNNKFYHLIHVSVMGGINET